MFISGNREDLKLMKEGLWENCYFSIALRFFNRLSQVDSRLIH